jgi:FKBP-type peptidyl-prolyl cis-trans isomerase SlyD
MRFPVDTPDGPRALTVIRLEEDQVIVDGNHPLAGQSVRFDVEIRHVRPASPQELQEGIVDP